MKNTRTSIFPPDAIASINRAYAVALRLIGADGSTDRRARLAEIMMSLARDGETDEKRLCDLSVAKVLGDPSASAAVPFP